MLKSIITTLAITSLSLAGDLKFDFTADLGFIPKAVSREYKTPVEDLYKAYDKVFNLRLRPMLEYKCVYGIIDITSFSSFPKSGNSLWPFRTTFGNELGLFYGFGSYRLSLGWEHNCSHRIITTMNGPTKTYKPSDNGYDNFFIRFHYSNFR